MSSLSDMVPTIIDRTKKNRIRWEELSNGAFYTELGDLTLLIDQEGRTKVWGEISDRIILYLRNSNGKVIQKIETEEENQSLLEDLYRFAYRQANRVDESLSKLETMLNKLGDS